MLGGMSVLKRYPVDQYRKVQKSLYRVLEQSPAGAGGNPRSHIWGDAPFLESPSKTSVAFTLGGTPGTGTYIFDANCGP